MKKIIIKIICAFSIIILAVPINGFEIVAESSSKTINGEVILSDVEIDDITAISIEIYTLDCTGNYDIDYIQYIHNFVTTVHPDCEGKFYFDKPSSFYYVKMLSDTLPTGVGIEKDAFLLSDTDSKVVFTLKSVCKEVTDLQTGSVSTNNYEREKVLTPDDIISRLENNEYSSIEELYDLYYSLYELKSNVKERDLSDNISYRYVPNYSNESTYTKYGFTLHYENGMYSSSLLRLIASQFNYAKTSLCVTYDYLLPPLKTDGEDNGTYHVYLNPNMSVGGVTLKYLDETNGSSYVVLRMPYNLSSLSDNYRGVIVHEFMHAIQYSYLPGFASEVNDLYLFCESGAHLSAVSCVSNYDISSEVNPFQNTPEKSLFCDDGSGRGAGAMLFLLYIKENFDDLNSIRTIYEKCQNGMNIYTAINNTLLLSNSSLKSSYTGFRAACYDIRTNYEFFQSAWINTPKKTGIYEDYTSHTMPILSALYFEKQNTGGGRNYTFTFGTENGNVASNLDLQCIVTNSNGTATIYHHNFTGAYCTVTYYLNTNAKICFVLSNISTGQTEEIYANVV